MEKLRNKEPVIKKEKSVMLITGGVLHQIWTEFSMDKFEREWQNIFFEMKKRSQFHFIIKPRPGERDFGWWYKDILERSALDNVVLTEDKRVEDLLDKIWLSVLVGKPGTAGYVSLLKSVPVLFLDGLLGRDVIGYRKWKEILPVFNSVGDLFSYIDKLAEDESLYQEFHKENTALSNQLSKPFDIKYFCRKIGELR